VVTAECDYARMILPIGGQRDQLFSSECVITKRMESFSLKESLVAFFNLLDSVFVIIGTVDSTEIVRC
jgi:hypothetical protein